MDRQSLRDWVIRFNAEGVEGLRERPRSGRPPWLDEGQLAAFQALVLRGPDPERAGVSTWRAKDLCRIVEQRFGVRYAENGMLRLLHDRGLSWQKTRALHPEADRAAQARLKKIPALIAAVARDHPEAERLEVWFLDEAQVGQSGRLCRLMDRAGARHLPGALLVVLTPQMLPLTPQLSPTVAPIAPPAASGCTQPGEMRVSGAGITSSRAHFSAAGRAAAAIAAATRRGNSA